MKPQTPEQAEHMIRLAMGAAMQSIEQSSRYRFTFHQPGRSLAAQAIREGIERAIPLLDSDYES